MSKHREPAILRDHTVLVDTRLGVIYRVGGATLGVIRRDKGARK